MSQNASLILTNGQFHTLDRENPLADAVAIKDGKILAVGTTDYVMGFAGEGTQLVDLKGHTVIPGLNDSHLHLIRGGLNYNLELRWEGVPSLADALRMLKIRRIERHRRSGFALLGAGLSFSLLNAGCQRLKN